MHRPESLPFELDTREVVCTLTRIKVSRLTLGHTTKLPKVSFELSADIKEAAIAKGNLDLTYKLYIDSNPAAERAELEGHVVIKSPKITAGTDLQALGEDSVSDIAMKIYSKTYETLYLTCASLGLPAPPPMLIQDVHLEPGLLDLDAVPAENLERPTLTSVAASSK